MRDHKTKAALPGRQCQSTNIKPSQNTILIDQVNRRYFRSCAGATLLLSNVLISKQSSNLSFVAHVTELLAEFDHVTGNPVMIAVMEGYSTLAHTPGNTHSTKIFVQPFSSEFKAFSHAGCIRSPSFFPHITDEGLQERIKKNATITISTTSNQLFIFLIIHPFGSMPRCCNSLRMMRFIHAAKDSSPSWRCASSIKSRSSGSSRNWNGGLPRLSFLCVDTFSTLDVVCLCVITHYMHMNEKATPRSGGTLPRRLTTTLIGVTVMAETQSTQTRPKFTFLFLAIHFAGGKPTVLRIEADTEVEARSKIAPSDFTLIFAAQIRTESTLQFRRIDLDTGRIELIHRRYQITGEVHHV